jgi:hypothetical protein
MKTSELTGPALDWAVAKAGGKTPKVDCTAFRNTFKYCIYLGWSYDNEGRDSIIEYRPSTNWLLGGPIIEREGINTRALAAERWEATNWNEDGLECIFEGPTPLIAAMRCYVASKLGDEVEIPKELT